MLQIIRRLMPLARSNDLTFGVLVVAAYLSTLGGPWMVPLGSADLTCY